jgi:drug/metabolite transporter (DMT)-like permease
VWIFDSAELLALAGAVFNALSHVAAKRAVRVASPTMFLAVRWAVSATMVALVTTLLGAWDSFVIAGGIAFVVLGAFFGPVGAWSCYTRSILHLDVSIAYALSQFSILGSMLLAILILGERPSMMTLAGAGLVVVGASLLQGRPDRWRQSKLSRVGALLALGAAGCWAVSYFLWKVGLGTLPVLEVLLIRSTVAAIILQSIILRFGTVPSLPGAYSLVTRQAIAYAALVSLLADVCSFGLQFAALRIGNLTTVGPIVSSSPLFLVGLSAVLLGERVDRWQLLGICIIVFGVGLVAGLG